MLYGVTYYLKNYKYPHDAYHYDVMRKRLLKTPQLWIFLYIELVILSQDFRRELSAKEPSINEALDNVKSFLIELPGEERKPTHVERGTSFLKTRYLQGIYLRLLQRKYLILTKEMFNLILNAYMQYVIYKKKYGRYYGFFWKWWNESVFTQLDVITWWEYKVFLLFL